MQRNKRKTIEWQRLQITSRKLDTKGTFHAKMGTTEDRNSEQKRLRRGGTNIQKNYLKKEIEKVLMIQITAIV